MSCRTSPAPSRPHQCPPQPLTWRGKMETVRARRCRLHQGPDPYQWVGSNIMKLAVVTASHPLVLTFLSPIIHYVTQESVKQYLCCRGVLEETSSIQKCPSLIWWSTESFFLVFMCRVLCRSAWKWGQLRCAGYHWVHPWAGHGSHWIQALQVVQKSRPVRPVLNSHSPGGFTSLSLSLF